MTSNELMVRAQWEALAKWMKINNIRVSAIPESYPVDDLQAYMQDMVTGSPIPRGPLSSTCPKCGGKLSILGRAVLPRDKGIVRSNHFVGCARYPECRYTRQTTATDALETIQALEKFHKELQDQDW